MIGKIKYILVLLICYSCGYDDCADDVNATNGKYDKLIEQIRAVTPIDEEQIRLLNIERGAELKGFDC